MSKDSIKTVSIKKSTNGKASAEAKKPSIEDVRNLLDEQIRSFKQKSELIRNRSKFLATKEELQQFIAKQGVDYDSFMEDSGKKVVFTDNERYSNSTGISISNNYLVREFAEFMINKIEIKISELEYDIMN